MRRSFRATMWVSAAALSVVMSSLALVAATAPPAQALSGTSRFVPLPPTRLVDTRQTTPLSDNGILTLKVTGRDGVPASAVAVVLNVTATGATDAGFVTAYPAGIAPPEVSTLNLPGAGSTVANLATVPVGANGSVSFFTAHGTNLIADIFGYYEPSGSTAAGRFVSVTPERLFDSRTTGVLAPNTIARVSLTKAIPANATAAVLNITLVDARAAGFVTVYAAGATKPDTSNVNAMTAHQTVANQVIVPITAGGVDVFSDPGGHVLVDVAGYFTGATSPASDIGLFVPVTPTRFLDTRSIDNPIGAHLRPSAGFTLERNFVGRSSVPTTVSAIVMNTTLVNAREPGFVTTYGAGSGALPNVSTLNVGGAGATVANHTITTVTSRGVAFYTSGGGHLLADVSGYFTGAPRPAVVGVPVNPEPATPRLPGQITIPKIGLDDYLYEGIDINTVNEGPGHWPGTAGPGSVGNMTTFGHRVSHSHPYQRLDELDNGDPIYVTAEGVTYEYRVVATDITLPSNLDVLSPQDPHDRTMTLVACHPPTSITYRIVVKARYVGITTGVVAGI